MRVYRKVWSVLIFGIGSLVIVGCLPKYLQRYSSNEHGVTTESSEERRGPAAVTNQKPKPNSIYLVDLRTFRFRLDRDQVWESTISVLMKNYNLNIVDKSAGIVTTEWDSFYVGEKVYRNKISMFIKPLAWNMVDVVVYNNVEFLNGYGEPSAASVWLPAEDDPKEIGRIVQNMAIYLKKPIPTLPEEMIAKSSEVKEENKGSY